MRTLYIKIAAGTLLAATLFLYGFSVSHFQVFPYQQFQKVKQLTDRMLSGEGEQSGYEVEVIDTSLKRLFTQRVFLGGDAFTRPQYISSAGDLAYLITLDGNLLAFSPELAETVSINAATVPMNHQAYLASGVQEYEMFHTAHFKVSEIYAEESGPDLHTIYVTHNYYRAEEDCVSLKISRLEVNHSEPDPGSGGWETFFIAEPCLEVTRHLEGYKPYPGHMAGGKITAYDEENLLVSLGTLHRDGIRYDEAVSMDPDTPYGKFILINKESGEYTTYAKGSRNAQGLLISDTGVIWSVEHGPEGGDRLNIVEKGRNFGWPQETYGINYGAEEWPMSRQQGRVLEYDEAAFVWIDAIAPSAMIQLLHHEAFSLWEGDLLIGSLRDQSLHRVRTADDERVLYTERIHIGERVRDLTMFVDGVIAIITESRNMILIGDGGPVFEDNEEENRYLKERLKRFQNLTGIVGELIGSSSDRSGDEIFSMNCASCHNLNEVNLAGPHLSGIFEREPGALEDFSYSQVLQRSDGEWTPEKLKNFLLRPEETFPGSSMLQITLTEEEAVLIIEFLRESS